MSHVNFSVCPRCLTILRYLRATTRYFDLILSLQLFEAANLTTFYFKNQIFFDQNENKKTTGLFVNYNKKLNINAQMAVFHNVK